MADKTAIDRAITELHEAGNLTVSGLADKLHVSRAWVYKNYPELKGHGKRVTDDDVLAAIEAIRAEKPSERISIEDLSKRLGITRQTFGRNFKHLYDYLKPEVPIFSESSNEDLLIQKVHHLEHENKLLIEAREIELKKKEDEIFSTLMRQDSEAFDVVKSASTMRRIQDQAAQQANLAKKYVSENTELRDQLSRLQDKTTAGGCEVVNHLIADYSAISKAEKPSLKEITQLFWKAEKRNFEIAEEIIVEQRPNFVILFLPVFSCDYSAIPVLPIYGKVIIVESNSFREDLLKRFVNNLSEFPVIVAHSVSSLAKTKLFCRGIKVPFSDDFISKIHESMMPPLLSDGYAAVVQFDPGRLRK
ncbi:helix-turn-helix transcriptional regulator [Marinobacter changyiensis]|uniref:helix-turn-helix transcriptional regulator n=1 Tax=Marinobacter changyiensis TaxID=2604091 RepID=UPI001264D53E|nr:helix-turn-helix transcriptional regulator [Marinobacter changyiensis]